MTNKKEPRVRKSNNLIEARFKLTVTEFRILLYCAAKIEPLTPEVSRSFKVYAKDYAEMFGISEKNAYKQIREGLDATWDREFYEWLPAGEGKEPGWRRKRFVISQEYHPAQGYGSLEVHPDFLAHLIDLHQKYTDYALQRVSSLTSFNALRMYELLAQYAPIGRRKMSVQWFQELLFLEDSYQRWTDLKKHVIVPSLEAINRETDIEIIKDPKHGWFTPYKEGRQVVSFEIKFRRRRQHQLELEAPISTPKPQWEELGYRSPKEYEEARYLERKHNVRFASASEFIRFRTKLVNSAH